jgi:hypothetical protein
VGGCVLTTEGRLNQRHAAMMSTGNWRGTCRAAHYRPRMRRDWSVCTCCTHTLTPHNPGTPSSSPSPAPSSPIGTLQGSARVIRCLQDHRTNLSQKCAAALFDHEVKMAEDIDFKYPMRKACAWEISKMCKDVPKGHARVVRCLQVRDGCWATGGGGGGTTRHQAPGALVA